MQHNPLLAIQDNPTLILQLIPMAALIAYLTYMIYYYVIPTAYLRLLIYYALKRYEGIDIRFSDNWVTVKPRQFEQPIGREIDIEIPNRLLEYAVCSALRQLLREVKRGPVKQ